MRRSGRLRARLGPAALLVLLALGPVRADGPAASADELFVRGNDQYADKDYAAAADSYRQILKQGVRNSRVYYNLGNACFKNNQIGPAILYYERALKLDPTDEDARENLRYANQRIRDRIPSENLPLLLVLLVRARDLLRLEQVTRLFLAAYLAAMALAAAWLLGQARRWALPVGIAALILLGLALVAGGWMAAQAGARAAADRAIVLAEKVEVLSGPGAGFTLLASVHEGTKVRIHRQQEEWVQIVLPDGRAGWTKGESLGLI